MLTLVLIVLPPGRQTTAQSRKLTWKRLTGTLESPSGTTHKSLGSRSLERGVGIALHPRIPPQYGFTVAGWSGYLSASEPHENVSHNALPLAFEHTFLERVQQLQVLLDQKPQSGGERTAEAGGEGAFATVFCFLHAER